ncbi:MAG: sulfite exporter TauE/SafE family protein [Chitinophagales bacterium]
MDIDWWMYPLIILAGALAGFINTLAGNGSAVTLPLLVMLGLPPNVANGTNRVGVVLQSITATFGFHKKGMIPKEGIWWMIFPSVLGALIGASIAVNLTEESMRLAMGFLMVFLLILVLLNPKKWLAESVADMAKVRSPRNIFIFFLIGLHGGFLQAGVGVMLLAALVLGAGYSLRNANGVKMLIVLAFSLPAFLTFISNGQVNWAYGLLIAVGQSFGGWLGVVFASDYPNANVWVRRILIVVIVWAIGKFFGLYDYLSFAV